MKRLFAACVLVSAFAYGNADTARIKSDAKSVWGKIKTTTKRTAGHVKKAGKEIGRGTQEIFDPNDEDLRKKK